MKLDAFNSRQASEVQLSTVAGVLRTRSGSPAIGGTTTLTKKLTFLEHGQRQACHATLTQKGQYHPFHDF